MSEYDSVSSLVKEGYITVNPTPPASNIVVFGNTSAVTRWPTGLNHRDVGGASAIRRDGSMDTFVPGPSLPSDKTWVAVTNGAAITDTGDLASWTPGFTDIRWNRCGNYRTVAVSQWRDWLLTIYLDKGNQTQLMPIANPASPPSVFKNTPTKSGWIKVAAGATHALALTTDGHLVAWGDNTYGQNNLPTDIIYRDIDAGDGFSLALSTDGTIYAAGKDDYGQVSGKPTGNGYIQVEAGAGTAAALDKDGHIVTWGKPLPGLQPPTDAGYTDIALGPDYGIALREMAPEVIVTTPLSPSTALTATDGSTLTIPPGSTFEHTHNGIMRVVAPDGHQILWANDAEATPINFPDGSRIPTTLIHTVPARAFVNTSANYHATVYPMGSSSTIAEIHSSTPWLHLAEDAWFDEQSPSTPQTFPQAVCINGQCSVAATTRGPLLISEDPMPATGDVPVFTVSEFCPGSYAGTLSTLGSTNPAASRAIVLQKNNVDPTQPVGFNVISPSGANVVVSARAQLTSQNTVLQYTAIATATQQLPTISITPRIWRQEPSGDVLVYTGAPTTCSATTTCPVEGAFTPHWDFNNATGTFFANVTTIYALPTPITTARGSIISDIATIYQTRGNEPVPEVIVTGPLSPLEPGKLMVPANANNTVPWGGTIEHGMKDDVPMTVVYDALGNAQFRADDTDAETLWTPWGASTNTANAIMIPNSTHLNTTMGNVVTLKRAPSGQIEESQENIMTIIYLNPVLVNRTNEWPSTQYCTVSAPNWVEWATMSTSTMPNFYAYNSNWIIPDMPQETRVGAIRADATKRTTISTWNGIENTNVLIQAVPAWNWYYTGSSDTFRNFDQQWSWAIWGKDDTRDLTFLTEPKPLTTGDSFAATYWITSSSDTSTTWRIHAGTSADFQEIEWSTADLTRNNGDLEVAEEAYLLREAFSARSTDKNVKYFPKSTRFSNFRILDTAGNTITPAFADCIYQDEWGRFIPTLRTEIVQNPYAIILHTTS